MRSGGSKICHLVTTFMISCLPCVQTEKCQVGHTPLIFFIMVVNMPTFFDL